VEYFYPECSYEALSRARMVNRKKVPSKVHAALGGGKVADAVLWRDLRLSASMLGVVLALYWLFFVSGRTFVSVAADALIYAYIGLALYIFLSNFARSRFGMSLPEIPKEIPEHHVKSIAPKVAYHWNNNVYPHMHRMFVEKDVALFVQVSIALFFLRYVGYFHTSTLVFLGILFVFVGLPFYDRHQHHVDALAKQGLEHAKQLHGHAKVKFTEAYATSYEKLTKAQVTANEKLTQAHATAHEQLTKLNENMSVPNTANNKLPEDEADMSTPTKFG